MLELVTVDLEEIATALQDQNGLGALLADRPAVWSGGVLDRGRRD